MKIRYLPKPQYFVAAFFENKHFPVHQALVEEQLPGHYHLFPRVIRPLLDPDRRVPVRGIYFRHEEVALNERGRLAINREIWIMMLRSQQCRVWYGAPSLET